MVIIIKQIVVGFLLGWFATNFTPFKSLLGLIKQYGIHKYLYKLVSCPKCATFWITLVISQNIILAIAASFIADFWDRHFNSISI